MKTPADGWDAAERDALPELGPELEALRRRHSADLPVDLLQAAREDVLPDQLQRDAKRYLAQDRWARTLIDDLAATRLALPRDDEDRLLRRIRGARNERGRRPAWRWFMQPQYVFATLAVIVAAGSVTWYLDRDEVLPPAQREEAPVAAREPIAFALPLEKPAVKLSLAALTWRGGDRDKSLAERLRPGLDAFRTSDYTTANQELARVSAEFPEAVEPVYYQGVARLFLNDVSGALDSLSAAARLADASFGADVAWYLAIAEERAGRMAEARAHVASVCESKSARSAEACAVLPKLK